MMNYPFGDWQGRAGTRRRDYEVATVELADASPDELGSQWVVSSVRMSSVLPSCAAA
jgi:hypothetical protein